MRVRTLALALPVLAFGAGCGGGSKSSGPASLHFTVSPTTIPAGQEFYQCFYVVQDVGGSAAAERGAVRFSYTAGGPFVHHMVVFTSHLGEADGTTQKCQVLTKNGWLFRYAGGVGTGPLDMPAGVASPLEPQTTWVIQIHYLNASNADVTDTGTTVDVDFVDPGYIPAQLGILGSTNFTIPANSGNVDVTDSQTYPAGAPDAKIFGLWPHMHQIGVHFRADIVQNGGATTYTPIDEAWNFGDQKLWQYPGAQEITIHGGDVLKTTCTYNNTSSAPVSFGESSTDEMCFDFVYLYTP